jgi:hypothetical protein
MLEYSWSYRFGLAQRGLRSQLLDWRRSGAQELSALVVRAREEDVKVAHAAPAAAGAPAPAWRMTSPQLLRLIAESGVLDDIIGARLHLEVMKIMGPTLHLLVEKGEWA